MGSYTCSVGPVSFKVIAEKKVSDCEKEYRYETGAVWREITQPNYNRELISAPIRTAKDFIDNLIPDYKDETRYSGVKEAIEYYHERGYFVNCGNAGFWSGIYYYYMRFEDALASLLTDEGFMSDLISRVGKYILRTTEEVLKLGADCAFWPDDLGTGQSLIFSPSIYEKYFYPLHKKMAELCHRYGALAHLHSHGHIQDLMDMIVDTGIDIINPIGPSDHNDLEYFKKRWGDKICLHGGISTRIMDMTEDEIREHTDHVLEIGLPGGRFIPRTESGIPPMPYEKMKFYLNCLKEKTGN